MTIRKPPGKRLASLFLTLSLLLTLLPTAALASGGLEIIKAGETTVSADADIVQAPNAYVNEAYTLQLEATGGTEPLTWTNPVTLLTDAGLTLNQSTGLISGTPTEHFTGSYTIAVTDANGNHDSVMLSITCYNRETDKPAITTESLPDGYVGANYYVGIDYTGYMVGDVTLKSGELPTGLSLTNPVGGSQISGKPTQAGTYTFTLQVSNAVGTAEKTYTITIGDAAVPPTIATTELPYAVVGREYNHRLTATGTDTGDNPIKWSISSGALPDGLSLSESGLISGTPSDSAVSGSVEIAAANKARSGQAQEDTKYFYFQVYGPPVLQEGALPAASLGQSYNESILHDNVTEIHATGLPDGMTLEYKNGSWSSLSGTPTRAGTFNIQVTATRKVGADVVGADTKTYTLVVDPPSIITETLPSGKVGVDYQAKLTCSNMGDVTGTWSLASGSNLPGGLSLSNDGEITGKPTQVGTFDFTVQLQVPGATVEKAMKITVGAADAEYVPPKITSPDKIPYAVVGRPYSYQLTATGTQPITWEVESGSLPAGLELNPTTGLISGTPTDSEGQASFTLIASSTNNGSTFSSRQYTYMQVYAKPGISGGTQTVYGAQLTDGALDRSYYDNGITVNNTGITDTGTSDTSTEITLGRLPNGIKLDDYGKWLGFKGKPTEAGTFYFQVTATRKIGDDVIGTDRKLLSIYIEDTPAKPYFSVPSGTAFVDELEVQVYCDTPNAKLYYRTDDQSPTNENGSTQIKSGDTITITKTTTLTVRAYGPKELLVSDPVSATYTKVDKPAKPTASPASGSIAKGTEVTLSSSTVGDIYYTTNGSEPTKSSGTLYSGPISITKDTTIKARVYAGTAYSDAATFEYTVVDGVTVSGTAVSWNATDDAEYYLYPSSMTDADIRAQWKTGGTVSGYTHTGTKNAITATTVDGKAMQSQTFSFSTVPAGTYKLVIFKPEKYVPKIVTITVGSTALDLGQQKLWLYGDVNYDGVVTGVDASQVLRYTKMAPSIFSSGTEQEKVDRLEAANVTYPKNGDTEITGTDASQILRYTKLASSVFNYIP